MKTFGVSLFGALFGALVTWMVMSDREPFPSSKPSASQTSKALKTDETDSFSDVDPFSDDSPPAKFGDPWSDQLEEKSGRWTSVDGQYEVTLDWRIFTIGELPSWANVEQQTFQLDRALQFFTGNGFYSIHFIGENANSMRLIRCDGTTDDYKGITLYREGHPLANSRKPLPKTEIPKKIQEMLAKFNTVLGTDTASKALGRIGLKSFRSMEHLDGESRWGETRGVIDLGIEGEWMIKYANSQKSGVFELQIFRGLVTEYRETGETLEEIVYPHIYGDYFIESPSKHRKFR